MAENNIPGLSNVVTDYLDNLNKGKAKITYKGKYGDVSMSPRDKLPPTLESKGLTPEEDKLTWGDWHPETISKYPEEYAQMRIDQHNKYNQGFIPDKSVKYADMVKDRAQNILIDAETDQLLDDARTKAINEYNKGKAQRDKEAKEKADAEAQEAEEAKHRKAEKMWSAIGDGISAIADMATVGAGADSMYNPADSLHSKVKSKWDEIKANKAAVAAANRKAQMDLLLKEYELGVKSKEAEANRNFNIWKTETEEAGRNQRAKEDQEFKASEKQKDRDNDKEVAKIRGKYSRSSGGGSSSTGKYFFNGKAYKSASERNQAILNAAKKFKDFEIYDDDDNLRDWDVMAVELEDLIAQGESLPQPQAGNYAQRWGSMFGGNSTSVPSAKPSKSSTTKYDPKKDTTSLYN